MDRAAAPVILAMLCLLPACADLAPPPQGPPAVLEGHWSVVARAGEGSMLARMPRRADGRGDPARADTAELLVHAPGAAPRALRVEMEPVTLPGIDPAQGRALRIGWVRRDGQTIPVALPGEAPLLHRSPADPGVALFEDAGSLWRVEWEQVRAATATAVGGFDQRRLAGMQREGEVILYWAAAPVWSPDGRFIAYASNREAVAAGARGQSIWLLELETGRERPLLADPGGSYRPIGWLGDELLFIGDEPGIGAVDPASGERRRVAEGTEVAVSGDGAALAVASDQAGETRIRVLTSAGEVGLPPAEGGLRYAPQGSFSPGGGRLLLEATADAGATRRFLIYDRSPARLRELEPRPATERPEWLDDRTLLLRSVDAVGGSPTTLLEGI